MFVGKMICFLWVLTWNLFCMFQFFPLPWMASWHHKRLAISHHSARCPNDDGEEKDNQDEVNLKYRIYDDVVGVNWDEICLEDIAVDYVGDGNEVWKSCLLLMALMMMMKGVLTSVVSSWWAPKDRRSLSMINEENRFNRSPGDRLWWWGSVQTFTRERGLLIWTTDNIWQPQGHHVQLYIQLPNWVKGQNDAISRSKIN